MVSELLNVRDSAAQVRATRRELEMPLVVVSAGIGREGVRGEINRELQLDQVTLSSQACHVVAEQSGHGIGRGQPDLVVDAIRAVFDASRDPASSLVCRQ